MIKNIILVSLCFVAISAASSCTDPQSAYYSNGRSIFEGLKDVQFAVQSVFDDPLDEVKYVSGGVFKDNYELTQIKPMYHYNANKQVEHIGDNSLTKTGGLLSLSVEFSYHWAQKNSIGVINSEGRGKGKAFFQRDFEVLEAKVPAFANTTGLLTFKCTLQDIILTDLNFTRISGEEPKKDVVTIFLNMLNSQTPISSSNSVKVQVQNRISGMPVKISEFTNEVPPSQFNTNHAYSWDGKRVDYDYTLKSYTLTKSGENIQLKGWPMTESESCLKLAAPAFENPTSYYAVSMSYLINSFNALVKSNQLNVDFDGATNKWNIPNFFYRVKDLAWVIPNLTDNFKKEDPVSGSCTLEENVAPEYKSDTDSFDTTMVYQCSVKGPSNLEILNFSVTANYKLGFFFNYENSLDVYVKSSDFQVTEKNAIAPFYLFRGELIDYYINSAAASMVNQKVFGTLMISLGDAQQPKYQVSDDGTTIFFYDAN